MSGISKKVPLAHWKKVMDKAGWETATDVANAAHLPYSCAHNAIYGSRQPNNETILKIAKAARIDPETIAADIFRYTLNIKSTKRSIAS